MKKNITVSLTFLILLAGCASANRAPAQSSRGALPAESRPAYYSLNSDLKLFTQARTLRAPLFGYKNQRGDLIEPRFLSAEEFVHGYAIVKDKNGRFGVINLQGNYVINPTFDGIQNMNSVFIGVHTSNDRDVAFNSHYTILRPNGENIHLEGVDLHEFNLETYSKPENGTLCAIAEGYPGMPQHRRARFCVDKAGSITVSQ